MFAIAMHGEQESLVAKNQELHNAFKERAKSQQQTQKMYQALKAQVMASHVANAAGDEAEYALNTAHGDRLMNRIPGTRTGSANFGRMGDRHQTGNKRPHDRNNSRSSESNGQQQGAVGIGPPFAAHLQSRGLNSRVLPGRKYWLNKKLHHRLNRISVYILIKT